MINDLCIKYLAQVEQQGLYRKRLLTNHYRLNFSSNDYLSLTNEVPIKNAYCKGYSRYASGSSGSMVICGYHPIHKDLEQAFSKALNSEDALLFSSGYAANLAIVSLLARFKASLLIDKALHASFYDGISLSGISYSRFLHNNLSDLAIKLTNTTTPSVVITEGVFSMSGQMPDLKSMASLCYEQQAELVVDEAHAFGVFGPQGLGRVMDAGLNQDNVPLRIIPFGKALGAQGAIVVGQKSWIDVLVQSARSYIYSTGLSPALTYGLLESFEFVRKAEDRRQKLYQLIDYFRQSVSQSSLTWQDSLTPIQQLQLGCPHRALICAEFLGQQGILCQPLREPTVSKKATGLRIILNYHHEFEDIKYLFSQLDRYVSLY